MWNAPKIQALLLKVPPTASKPLRMPNVKVSRQPSPKTAGANEASGYARKS